jgi:hypothetical protein
LPFFHRLKGADGVFSAAFFNKNVKVAVVSAGAARSRVTPLSVNSTVSAL